MQNESLPPLDVFQVRQSVGVFYACVIPAKTLLRIVQFDFRQIRDNGGIKDFMGIQRPLNDKRVRDIAKYIETSDGAFPTSIVVSVDERCADFISEDGDKGKLIIRSYVNSETQEEVIPLSAVARIIDGQHRLKAFEYTDVDWDLTVNIFVGASEGTQAMLFSKVNLAQTKVNRSLVYDLFSLDKGRSPEKTCHEIVVNLNQIERSPFYQRIKRLGSATEGVFGETLSQATVVHGILPLITKDPIGDRDFFIRTGDHESRGPEDFRRRIFYPFFQDRQDHLILATLINYFTAIRNRWPSAWESSGRGSVLSKTNGFNASVRFLRDAYLHLTTTPTVPSTEDFEAIFRTSDLNDSDFNTQRFPPGSSGSARLFEEFRALLP